MAFYEALRATVRRYAAGVHHLSSPATPSALQALSARLGRSLPVGHHDFLRSFDGVELFLEAQILFGADGIAVVAQAPAERPLWHVGETPDGALWLDSDGRLLLADDSAPDPIVAGSSTEAFINATLAREALVVDRDGEFRDVFGDEGLELDVRKKRARLGQRHDPKAALPLLETAEVAYEEGDTTSAQTTLQQAVLLDPHAGPAWELLAALYQAAGQLSGAEHAALQAAAATWHGPLRASRLMQAARVCPTRAQEHARAAWTADPQLAERLLVQAQQHLDESELPEARYLTDQLQLLLAAEPAQPDQQSQLADARQKLVALEKQVRSRSALHVIG